MATPTVTRPATRRRVPVPMAYWISSSRPRNGPATHRSTPTVALKAKGMEVTTTSDRAPVRHRSRTEPDSAVVPSRLGPVLRG